jgi:hypothetical protein
MGDDFALYINRLELLAFFSGYPLVYAIIQFIAGARGGKPVAFVKRLMALLPFAYALTGTLFLGMLLKESAADFGAKQIEQSFHYSFLRVWGILAVLFWIPALSRKPAYSLLHSLVFFLLLLYGLVMGIGSDSGRDMIRNDMKIYTDSLIINMITLATVATIYFSRKKILQNKGGTDKP